MEEYYYKCTKCGKGMSIPENQANEDDLCDVCQKEENSTKS